MVSPHANAVRVGLRAAGRVAGRSATYRTKSGDSFTLANVVQGSSPFTVEDPYDGVQHTAKSADWIFEYSQLGQLPESGDKIERTFGKTTETYEVSPFGPDERVYSWVDREQGHIRVHTKRTS